jgi:hypothetical protein|tara:strand:- start:110 stop:262 length:153 start_codon:yes stop_codon:yes gene_type:complete
MIKTLVPLALLSAATLLAGCSSNNTLSDAEVERERARANEVHREMDRETR